MKIRIPVAKLAVLAAHAASASKGGFSRAEAQALGVEALGIARIILNPLLPETVAPVVGVVLDTVSGLISSPPASVGETAQVLLEAIGGVLPVDVEIDG